VEALQQITYVSLTAEPMDLNVVFFQVRRQTMALDECWQISRVQNEKA
jgi:hypothetical protein